ncbi:MAG: hypothetical protein QGM46_10645, partial [Actinomycetota bacterium]|nr:hypothetical protein [Actinomycetota bacterium]
IENSAVEVTAVPVGEWVFRSLEFDLRSAEDINRLESELSDLESKSLLIVRLTLVGQLSLGDKIRLDSILEHLSDLFASLNTWERHSDLVILPDDDDFTSLGLSGFAQDALAELVELASDDEAEASNAQEALGLLYRLAGGSA